MPSIVYINFIKVMKINFNFNINQFYKRFPEVDHLNGTILRLDEVDYYYNKDEYVFKKVDISATMDSRICIVGENGSGNYKIIK
jgi:ATPase subunit of ABC transporter with duplicated ATPase domains